MSAAVLPRFFFSITHIRRPQVALRSKVARAVQNCTPVATDFGSSLRSVDMRFHLIYQSVDLPRPTVGRDESTDFYNSVIFDKSIDYVNCVYRDNFVFDTPSHLR